METSEKLLPKTPALNVRKNTAVEEQGDKGRLKLKVVVGKNGTIENKVVRDYAKGA